MKQSGIVNVNDVRVVINLLLRNWYWFVICILISGIISYFYTYRLADIYAAKTQVILESGDENPANLVFSNNYYNSFENVASQQRVIKSANLIEGVIDQLDLNISYFIVGRIKTTEVYQNMPFKVSLSHEIPALYGTDFHLKIQDTSEFVLRYDHEEQEIEKKYKFGELITDFGFYFKIDKSPNLNEERARSAG
ncbi:MAG: Wzz/FepE/Etk N-terminal domain-containing protein, partial [Flavobacteriales bacterium]|nr:Wzz/FepE/Etk N-terminal domain-containing protein [Flavobacteriales bacterium]